LHEADRELVGEFEVQVAAIFASVFAVSAGFAAAGDAPRTATSLLARAVEVDCQPALPFFCRNIHVACSGRTEVRTFPFTLRVNSSRGWIESTSDASGIWKPYENASVDWGKDGTYVILRPQGREGYIRLLANGKYSLRHYSQDVGIMSHGQCHQRLTSEPTER
jgi:hypothetical protein